MALPVLLPRACASDSASIRRLADGNHRHMAGQHLAVLLLFLPIAQPGECPHVNRTYILNLRSQRARWHRARARWDGVLPDVRRFSASDGSDGSCPARQGVGSIDYSIHDCISTSHFNAWQRAAQDRAIPPTAFVAFLEDDAAPHPSLTHAEFTTALQEGLAVALQSFHSGFVYLGPAGSSKVLHRKTKGASPGYRHTTTVGEKAVPLPSLRNLSVRPARGTCAHAYAVQRRLLRRFELTPTRSMPLADAMRMVSNETLDRALIIMGSDRGTWARLGGGWEFRWHGPRQVANARWEAKSACDNLCKLNHESSACRACINLSADGVLTGIQSSGFSKLNLTVIGNELLVKGGARDDVRGIVYQDRAECPHGRDCTKRARNAKLEDQSIIN